MVVQEILQRRQEPWSWGMQWLAIRSWQRLTESNHRIWSSLTTTQEVAEELNVDPSMFTLHLKQTGKVKKLNKWAPQELTKNLKTCFEVLSSLFLCSNNEPFLNQIVMCDKKWILYYNMQWPTQWLGGKEVLNHYPKPNLHQKNIMVTDWWSSVGLIHCSFLNPGEAVISEKYAPQINEIYWKLQ